LLVFHYFPFYGILLAFKNFNPIKGILASDWAGLTYFKLFLQDRTFWKVMGNTLSINLKSLLIGFPFPIIFALVINEIRSKRFVKFTQTVSYLPHFISWVVASAIIINVLSPSVGLFAHIWRFFGREPVYVLTKKEYFQMVIVIAGIWKGFGMSAVYYTASIAGVSQDLYDSAAIDGAGRLRQTWHITMPGLRNIITVLLVLSMGNITTIGFDNIFLLYNPSVYETGDVISTYVYRMGVQKAQYSQTAAVGLTQNVVNFMLVMLANRLAKKIGGWSLW
jgi:putative aldouronate transport system permease protein